MILMSFFFFFFNDTATTEIYTLSLPRRSSDLQGLDADLRAAGRDRRVRVRGGKGRARRRPDLPRGHGPRDRKSTRLNSSHGYISYAVFCLKKKKTIVCTKNTCSNRIRRRVR